ncbi:MAG: ABC transporter substrate-binding protein [Acidobacteria bacterium]|nr:MAG: ABC transporter substrate-binding protein [Acidobacteriota bacterium]
MLTYNLRLAWKSVRRYPVLSALILLGIALGVGVSTTFITAYHVLARDPVPGKSESLYYVRMNSWGAADDPFLQTPPPIVTWRDAQELLKSRIPVHSTATFASRGTVFPADGARPLRQSLRLATADFFPMFAVPFRYGGPWSREADAKPETVAVIDSALNDRLFGGADSVGRTIRVEKAELRIVGVLAPWRPRVRAFGLFGSPLQAPESIFLPLALTGPMALQPNEGQMNWRTPAPGEDKLPYASRLMVNEILFLGFWAELPNPESVKAYKSFLDAYVTEQKKHGRFPHPLNNRLTSILDLMAELKVVPPQTKALAAISLLFLVVAALNLIGLFLGKFLARASTVGVRRALGASRWTIFVQHLVECELMGLAGGALGVLLSLAGLAVLNRVYGDGPAGVAFFQLDVPMVLAAVILSLLAGAIAGLYPAWRICAIPPARHLKSQ